MQEQARCNMIGHSHCGRAIAAESEVGNRCTAHFNMGNRPHEWRALYQCKECFAKDEAIRTGAAGQETWMERRRQAGLSVGQMARMLNLGTAVYSGLEHLRMVAPPIIREEFERIISGPKEERP